MSFSATMMTLATTAATAVRLCPALLPQSARDESHVARRDSKGIQGEVASREPVQKLGAPGTTLNSKLIASIGTGLRNSNRNCVRRSAS